MSDMWKAVRALWHAINALSTAAWLWGLPWAAGAVVITGWVAHAEHLPPVAIGVLALAAAVMIYVLYVATRLHRAVQIAGAPKPAVRTEPHPPEQGSPSKEPVIDREYRLAEYSPRPPVNTAPHLQPPEVQLVRLNGERIAHERKKERLEEAITKCGAAVEVYKASVRKHEREKVIRPTMWPDWPDKLLDQAISAFTGAELRAPMWAQEFNRPEAAFDTWVGPMCERRQMFDPENNPRYLAKHRENLVIFEEALRDTKREAQNADHDVRRVKREIDQQAKRLG